MKSWLQTETSILTRGHHLKRTLPCSPPAFRIIQYLGGRIRQPPFCPATTRDPAPFDDNRPSP